MVGALEVDELFAVAGIAAASMSLLGLAPMARFFSQLRRFRFPPLTLVILVFTVLLAGVVFTTGFLLLPDDFGAVATVSGAVLGVGGVFYASEKADVRERSMWKRKMLLETHYDLLAAHTSAMHSFSLWKPKPLEEKLEALSRLEDLAVRLSLLSRPESAEAARNLYEATLGRPGGNEKVTEQISWYSTVMEAKKVYLGAAQKDLT